MPDLAYIYAPIDPDDSALQDAAIEWLQSRWPDWDPSESHLETWQIMALSRMVAEAISVASDVPFEIFKYFGTSILGVPVIAPSSAEVLSTWTVTDNAAGRTIEAGFTIAISDDAGNPVAFQVVSDVDLAVGVLTTSPGEVRLRAITEGEDANGLGGLGTEADLLDPYVWVDTISLTGVTSNGSDGETDDDYLDRLSTRLTLLTPRPIIPRDFELLARDIAAQTGVKIRSVALDGFNPADSTTDNERMITLGAVQLDTGLDIPDDLRSDMETQLEALRETNFIVHVIDPTRTPVDVTFTIVVHTNADPDATLADAVAAVTDVIQPFNWGRDGTGVSDQYEWEQTSKVYRQKISQAITSIQGVKNWIELTIGLSSGAQSTAEIHDLPGAIPLATPGIVDGYVA